MLRAASGFGIRGAHPASGAAINSGRCCLQLQAAYLLHSFLRAAFTTNGWLKAIDIYSFIVLETKSLKLRGQQGHTS